MKTRLLGLLVLGALSLTSSDALAQVSHVFDNETLALAGCLESAAALNCSEGMYGDCIPTGYGTSYGESCFNDNGGYTGFVDWFYFLCPGNQTFLGGGICEDPCPTMTCDDGLACNGLETCDLGICIPGTPPDCSNPDGLTCTPGLCEEPTGCVDGPAVDELCECTDTPLPDVSVSVSQGIDELSIACPIVGGTASTGLSVSGSVKAKAPTCHNGCDSEANASLGIHVTATLCSDGKTPIDVALLASMTRKEDGCAPECKDGSCELTCGGGSCVTSTYSAGAAPNISRRLGVGLKPKRLFGSIWSVNCAAQVKGSVSLAGDLTETEDEGACTECKQCSGIGFTSTIGAGATATCRVRGGIFGRRFDLALEDLGSIEASISGDNRGTTGACGDTYCGSTLAVIKGGVQIPVPALGGRWWGILPTRSFKCSASWSGCAENNSCGTCSRCDSCADTSQSFTCGLTTKL